MSAPTFGEVQLAAVALGEALEKAGIRYFVGGSVASAAHGIPRFTQDLDDVVSILKMQGDRLDASYLAHWAPLLGITDLLESARAMAAGTK